MTGFSPVEPGRTGIAIVGTGFVADYYMTTLANHPNLTLVGVFDRDGARLRAFCDYWKVSPYASIDALLADPTVAIVVNLTTPENHYPVNRQALEAGKHVYCEKPLALDLDHARAVVALAEDRGLVLACAPANSLSDAFRHCRGLLDSGTIGRPRLVYAEMEDGPVFLDNWRSWRNLSGAPWPGVHEFELGCTLEHVGYATGWLVGLFGPVTRLTAFSTLAFPDKGPGTEEAVLGADLSVSCLTHASGVVARVTCGIAAPRDRSLTIVGDTGTIVVRDLWDNRSPVHVERPAQGRPFLHRAVDRIERGLRRKLPFRLTAGRSVPYASAPAALPGYPSKIDFSRGIAVQAEAIAQGQTPFFSGRMALHLTDVTLAINAGERDYGPLVP